MENVIIIENMDSSRNFKNELGNNITIEVSEQVLNGVEGVLVAIEGPTSRTDVHITRQEARVLLEQIQFLFDK